MNRLKYIIVSLWSLLPLLLIGQNVTITGRVNRPEALVRLMVYDDLLNMHETLVAQTSADERGFFILEGKVQKTMPAAIFVGLESADLVIAPGASYEVNIVVPEADPNASYFERESPTLRVRTATDKGVYRQIVISQEIIDYYVLNYFDELFRRRQYRYLDSIRATIDDELHVTDPYVFQYNTYRIAAVQMAVNADGGKKVIDEYYDGKPVLYHCQSYMDLFKDLFRAFTLTDEFASRNPELADMVNIYQLRNLYNEEYQSRQWVRGQLRSISKQSKSQMTKALVANTLARFDRFAQGAEAPDFELQSSTEAFVKLSDYKKSIVLLQFVDGSSYTVDHQFETLADLHQQWQDSVQIITVSTKDQLANHRRRFEEHHYDWPLLNLGNDILLLERYEVHTFPEYFIIMPDTKIGVAPAPSPDQTLKEYIRGMLEKVF